MTADVDAQGWAVVGVTANCRFFDVERGVLAALPLSPAIDDEATARENSAFHEEYFRTRGTSGVVILFFDGFVSQDTNARRVYREARRELVLAVAFVARSLLGRAIASFALGGRLPSARRKMFTTLEDALPWVRTQRDRTAHEEEP